MDGIKRFAALVLIFALASAVLPGGADAAELITGSAIGAELDRNAPWVGVTAILDGREILGARLIDGATYLPLRAVCEGAGYTVKWDTVSNTAYVTGTGLSLSVAAGAVYLIANGRYIYLNGGTAQMFRGSLFVPARPLAKALGWNVSWEDAVQTATFTSTGVPIEDASAFYNDDDVLWLARIISAEAGGEPFLGQIAVGAVVLNRVRSRQYPNTIYGVIFDRVGGVQFEPTLNGSIWRTPGASAVEAAKLAIDGANPVGGSLFFLNPRIARSGWIQRNRIFYITIGRHDFYL